MASTRGEPTRRRLLDSALAVYAEVGAEGFTSTAVLARSGVSVGSMYHHFGSFPGLAAALYTESMASLLDEIVGALTRTRTARTGVRAVVDAYLGWALAQPARARFLHGSAYATYLTAGEGALAGIKEPRMAAMARWLAPHIAAGRIADLPLPLLEMLIIGPPAEACRRWLAADPGIDLARAREVLPERVWRAVRGEDAPAD